MTTPTLYRRARSHFARKMEALLLQDDLPLAQLAARSHIHRVQLSGYLHARSLPLLNNGATIAMALGTTIQHLYGPYLNVVMRQQPSGVRHAVTPAKHRMPPGRQKSQGQHRPLHQTDNP